MPTYYNNIPQEQITDSASSTLQVFDQYGKPTLALDAATVDAAVGFFTSRGFDTHSAQSITYIILRQARIDGYKPFQIIDTLQGLDNVQISALVTELLNYNRYKSSSLGMAQSFIPVDSVQRNILA
jgi:hypothetical protein